MSIDRSKAKKGGVFRLILKIAVWVVALVVVVLTAAFLYVFRGALYNRYVEFPKQAAAWEAIRADFKPVPLYEDYQEFRAVLHSHSELSHDCMVTFPEIVQALKKADVNVIGMTDHYVDGKADYSLGWKGVHDGILFIKGYEMKAGLMPWGLPDDTLFSSEDDPNEVARRVKELGGVVFYAHVEEERNWDLPELEGMEIYNPHTDVKDEEGGLKSLLPDVLLNVGKYPEQTTRVFFDRQTPHIERWDELNKTRHITGISANDCHQNNGIRIFYNAEKNALEVYDTGHADEIQVELKLNFLTKLVARAFLGPLEPGKQLLRFELDPYERMSRFVNTHILAKEQTEEAIIDALRVGRCFVAFNMIADAKGFSFFAENHGARATMGEAMSFEPGVKLRAFSPRKCRFILMRDGEEAAHGEGYEFEYDVLTAAKYRIEAELDINGEWTPWVYTNPIDLSRVIVETAPEAPASAAEEPTPSVPQV